MIQRVLVAGATGYLGRHVASEFKARGIWVRALVRRPEQLAEWRALADDVRCGQVTDARTLAGIADGVDAVFSAVGITRQKDHLTYREVDYQGNLNLLAESVQGGAARFVYVSIFGGPALRAVELVDAKESFVDALRASAMPHCVVRPTGFFVDMGDIAAMARRGRVVLFGDGNARINPISGRDLAAVCADAVLHGSADVAVGGPCTFTYNEIAELAFRTLRQPAHVWHVPAPAARAAMHVLGALTPRHIYGPLQLVLATMGRDMVAPAHGSDRLDDYFMSIAKAT